MSDEPLSASSSCPLANLAAASFSAAAREWWYALVATTVGGVKTMVTGYSTSSIERSSGGATAGSAAGSGRSSPTAATSNASESTIGGQVCGLSRPDARRTASSSDHS